MCRQVKITAGAMLVSALSPRVVIGGMAVAGSGVALVSLAGATLPAVVWMVLVGWAAITTILLLRRRADPLRPSPGTPPPRTTTTVRVLAERQRRALPEAARSLDDDYAIRTPTFEEQ